MFQIGVDETRFWISEFDSSYMRDNTDGFDLIPPQNSDGHRVVDYSMSWKKTGDVTPRLKA